MTIVYPDRKIAALLRQLLTAGLTAADPARRIQRLCKVTNQTLIIGRRRFHLPEFHRVTCIGVGKASERMAFGLQRLLGQHLHDGIVVVKEPAHIPLRRIAIRQAGHPTPDARSSRAAKAVQRILRSLNDQDLVIMLISGGASSLLSSPASGLTLRDKQRTTQLLLRSGATIQEVNTVRKHLSAIKGGQLMRCTSATVISLILSDVRNDDLSTIASGLTAPDPTTFLQAREVLRRYRLWNRIPAAVTRHIEKGIQGKVPETLKPGDIQFNNVHHVIIGNTKLAVQHLARTARRLGIRPFVQTTVLQGEAKEIGHTIASIAKSMHGSRTTRCRPVCLIWGGEPTVTVAGRGRGGRVQECALAAAIQMAGLPKTIMAGLGTDGSDGPTDVAGAVVDGQTISMAREHGVSAAKALRSHDSYSFFQQVGGHITTGPTGTNVNDIYLLLML